MAKQETGSTDKVEGIPKLKSRIQAQLGMLAAQFLLGMAVNLLGDPGGGLAGTVKGLLLALHVLVAVGLLVNGGLTVVLASKLSKQYLMLARGAGAGIGVAILAGIVTVATAPPAADWWSYLMAVGFIVAIGVYGRLLGLLMQAK